MPDNTKKESNIKDLKLVKQVFEQFKISFFVAYGTCLGFYRDKNFLPDDDDIDLVVVEPIDLKTRKMIGWMLYDLGFQPQEIMFNVFGRMEPAVIGYNGDEETGIIVCQRNVKLTIFFFKPDKCKDHGEVMVCIPKLGAVKLIESPAKFYKQAEEIKIFGEKFYLPSPVGKYLEFTYEEWENPLKRDHGKTYLEMHAKESIKDLINEATIIKK